jgi:hypothetical protein
LNIFTFTVFCDIVNIMLATGLAVLGDEEFYRIERDCFDPGKLARAANQLALEIEYAQRPFFEITGTITEVCYDTDAIQELILDSFGLEEARATKAYRITTPRTEVERPVRRLLGKVSHSDSMPETVVSVTTGTLAVKLDGSGVDTPPIPRFDLSPGDRLVFRANEPHSFVPRDNRRRQSLSVPIYPRKASREAN